MVKYKKILVTPESFYKIREAIEESDYNLYEDFFLLFDECEKAIQDVNYRQNIIAPMDDFFKFTNKAFVSATPILPSDPRFLQQGFKIVRIRPTFNYSQPLRLITTNNVFSTLRKFIVQSPRELYFIFFNSTENIADFIQQCKIEEDSKVFCAKESSKKLILNQFKNVSTEIEVFKKFNFITSRFYSAVDIPYSMFACNPTIIMVTDLVFALHTKIDPFTEGVQIPGRFRKNHKKELNREIIHISNTNSDLTSMTSEQVEVYLKESHIVYRAIDRYLEAATSIHAKDTLRQMLVRIDYAKYLKLPEKRRNYFMVDNLIADELVNSYYQFPANLIEAYQNSKHYKLIEPVETETFKYTDKDRLKARIKKSPIKSLKKLLSERLNELYTAKEEMTEFAYDIELSNLQFDFAEQIAPIIKYGIDNAAKLKFDINAIQEEMKKTVRHKDYFGMMTYIQNSFNISGVYSSSQIARIIEEGFRANKVCGVKANVPYLRKFAKISDSDKRVSMGKDNDGKEIKGYKIFKFKDNPL